MIELDECYFERFSDTTPVELVPYDPALEELAQRYTTRLRRWVGEGPEIEHRGATALRMIGKGEIDLYVRVEAGRFRPILQALQAALGPPGSLEPHRARFSDEFEQVEIEVMLVQADHPEERAGQLFFRYMQARPALIAEYAQVKRRYAPVSRREYYQQKYRFIRSVLECATEALDHEGKR
jgi:GrpB-like predicted nucleotidyltransferase (UPF0157 family)